MRKVFRFLVLFLICISLVVISVAATDPLPPELQPIHIYNIDEYHQYVENTEFDYDFVSYEKVSYLGDFQWFEEWFINKSKDNQTTYELNITDNQSIYVGVNYTGKLPENLLADSSRVLSIPASSDLLYQQADARYVHHENLIYVYHPERHKDECIAPSNSEWRVLQSIYLIADGKRFQINFAPSLILEVPEDHPLYKFLSTETCDKAYDEFVYHITGEWPQKNNTIAQTLIEKLKSFDFGCRSVISGGAVTLLLCSGAAIAFIPKKKKRE